MSTFTWRTRLLIGAILLIVQATALHLLGQSAICTCGYVKLWEGVVTSAGTSQHLSDWYSFTHIIHGFLFYLLLWILFPRLSAPQRLLIALGLEISWEIAENTPYVIQAYRQQALARGYVGDSIINSLSDSCMMMLGFILAWRLPTWSIVVLALMMEIGVAYFIHDNLTLNILNFIHPFDTITQWQSGGV